MFGFGELSKDEQELSRKASKRLGFNVLVYRDGQWICQPYKIELYNGYGTSPEEAEADCKSRNS